MGKRTKNANSCRARYSRGGRTRFVTVPSELNTNAQNVRIIEAALAAGLYPKILTIDASGTLRSLSNQQTVAIVRVSSGQS